MRSFLAVIAFAAAVFWLSQPALAADFWYASDVVGADAGSLSVITINNGEQSMVRCETYNTVRYRVCAIDAGCTATSSDAILDIDKSVDICVPGGQPQNTKLGLYKQYDAGNPTCNVYKVFPVTPGLCPK